MKHDYHCFDVSFWYISLSDSIFDLAPCRHGNISGCRWLGIMGLSPPHGSHAAALIACGCDWTEVSLYPPAFHRIQQLPTVIRNISMLRSACPWHRKERTRYIGIQLSKSRRGMIVLKIPLYNTTVNRKAFYKLVLKRICTFIVLLVKLHNSRPDILRSFVTAKKLLS